MTVIASFFYNDSEDKTIDVFEFNTVEEFENYWDDNNGDGHFICNNVKIVDDNGQVVKEYNPMD